MKKKKVSAHQKRQESDMKLRVDAPTKIKLIFEFTFLLTSNPQHILMQNVLKSMINIFNPRYIQHLGQYLQHLNL